MSDCYATGAAAGLGFVGGLAGSNDGTLTSCYSAGAVTGSSDLGGLVGMNFYGTVGRGYWDSQKSGQTESSGGTGVTTAQMKKQATFAGWDFVRIWSITENVTFPVFRAELLRIYWQLTSGEVTAWAMTTNSTRDSGFAVSSVVTPWVLKAVGDIDGDGVADLVWQLPTGQVACWLLNSDATMRSVFIIYGSPTIWQVRTACDIDGDGIADLVWQLPTGQAVCWLMNPDGAMKSSFYIYNSATPWLIRAAGDMDGDGVPDLIWQLSTGRVACWLINSCLSDQLMRMKNG